MRTSVKIFVYATVASALLLACDDTGTNNIELISSSSNTKSGGSLENFTRNGIPTMDNRVVSYKRIEPRLEYIESLGYENSFATDKKFLKLWFPHIFNEELTDSECNYFALNFVGSSSEWTQGYIILSEDITLHHIGCTWESYQELRQRILLMLQC